MTAIQANRPVSTDAAPTVTARTAPAPSVHHRAALTWLAVYSMITAVQLLLGPSIAQLPLALRTLILTAIVVPIVVYLLVPALLRAHSAARRTLGNRR
jgi:antibiotic biosynthesis monooxygenase (ABM) superfamily enzyme